MSRTFEISDERRAREVFGHRDEHLRLLENELTVDIHVRGPTVTLTGDALDTELAQRALVALFELAEGGRAIGNEDVVRAVAMLRDTPDADVRGVLGSRILQGTHGRIIAPKTPTQKTYVETIRKRDIVFGIGPAGTGKTYLAMAMAVDALQRRQVKRLVLTRPAVEAGERLGFLPGDMQEKVSPYLRPLKDALHEMLDAVRVAQFVEHGVIEIAPLAFMRGRTLNDAFVILDEAQNATRDQMKMFLTRIGFGSRAVITGDGSQVDLQRKSDSGLAHAVELLENVPGIGVTRFLERDVVRHPLVRRIIAAYDADERSRESGQ